MPSSAMIVHFSTERKIWAGSDMFPIPDIKSLSNYKDAIY